MPDHRMPKMALFGWLPQNRPPGGPHTRWRDCIRKDLKPAGVQETEWYNETTSSRGVWRATYHVGLQAGSEQQLQQEEELAQPLDRVCCQMCSRTFRRESDKKWHKCVEEWSKPVWEQRGAVQCADCQKWFRSRGGLAVHGRPGTCIA